MYLSVVASMALLGTSFIACSDDADNGVQPVSKTVIEQLGDNVSAGKLIRSVTELSGNSGWRAVFSDYSVLDIPNEFDNYTLSDIVSNDDFVQFDIENSSTSAVTGYRFGREVTAPVSVKIYNTVLDDVTAGSAGELVISVSPSNAIVNATNLFFDAVDEGIVPRSNPTFDDEGYFTITDVVPATGAGYNAGDYVVNFTFKDAIEGDGGEDWWGAFVYGQRFDVCITYTADPSAFTEVVTGGGTTVGAVDKDYIRSVNSFTFMEKEVAVYAEGDAQLWPATTSWQYSNGGWTVGYGIVPRNDLSYSADNFMIGEPEVTYDGVFTVDGVALTINSASLTAAVADYTKFFTIADAEAAGAQVAAYSITPAAGMQAIYTTINSEDANFVQYSYLQFSISTSVTTDDDASVSENLVYVLQIRYLVQ